MEFVEVRGKTVEIAVVGALAELGLESEDEAEVEVIAEGKKGFLGMGGEDAVVRVRPKPKKKRRRRRRRGKGSGDGGDQAQGQEKVPSQPKQPRQQPKQQPKPSKQQPKQAAKQAEKQPPAPKEAPEADDLGEQAEIVESFLTGLVGAFGIEGQVSVQAEQGVVEASVAGDHAEALVGTKGAVMNAVQEVTRTVVQRRFHQPARVRVDIAGYRERRREALSIYAERLAAQVIDEGGEIMLEPMNPADRKVVHDTISGIDGVESYSEGEDPRRSVVIAKVSETS